jgi:branched-chain amino acid transport system ATP-binding protein
MLELRDVTAAYGKSQVLQGISLHVDEGEVVALLGRNGVGKTTTLRTIMGLLRASSGRVVFDGEDLVGRPPEHVARRGVAFVPDDRRIFPGLTVEENLELARRAVAGAGRTGPWDAAAVYEQFPILADRHAQGGTNLSGGQQKMLALARALVQNPRLLLLDEATEGLAPLIVNQFVDIVRRVAGTGITLLVADQNLGFARRVASRAYIIHQGRIEHEDGVERIWADDELVRRYLTV